MGVPLAVLPGTARDAWIALRDELQRILGPDVVSMWGHGGTLAIQDPPHVADLDTYVIVASRPDAEQARRIEAAHGAIASQREVEWDAWYVLADAAGRPDPPAHAFHERRRDTSWAIHRAQWLAGRFASLHGPAPVGIVPIPRWAELETDLDRELEHVERHVVEGGTDAFEATYAHLTGSRILRALETRDVVISKRAAGDWGLAHLPARWHPALEAALRTYDGRPTAGDADLLADGMAPFVAFVRESLPPTGGRPKDAAPRWSGC